jgi:hypothetical protein
MGVNKTPINNQTFQNFSVPAEPNSIAEIIKKPGINLDNALITSSVLLYISK